MWKDAGPYIIAGIGAVGGLLSFIIGMVNNKQSATNQKLNYDLAQKNYELSLKTNERTLTQKAHEAERTEIMNKLNQFYGPVHQLLGTNALLYEQFTSDKKTNFKTLEVLLDGDVFAGNDAELLRQILNVNEKIDQLIFTKGGLVDDEKLQDLLWRASTHYCLIRLAYDGKLKKQDDRFRDHLYPKDLNQAIKDEIARLKDRLETLNAM